MEPPILPIPDADTRPFWQACNEGRLVAQVCRSCGERRLPPSPACPRCRSGEHRWEELTGRGKIWTYTVVHHAFRPSLSDQVPYVVGLIDLEGGPRIVGRIQAAGQDVKIGSQVRVRFQEVKGVQLPFFELEA